MHITPLGKAVLAQILGHPDVEFDDPDEEYDVPVTRRTAGGDERV